MGHEDDDQRQRRGEHRQRDLLRGVDGGLFRVDARETFQIAVNVLQHDDGVVDDDADGQRQRQQRHRVQRVVQIPHDRKGGDDRGGDRDRADQHRAEIPDEDPDDQRRQQRPEHEVLFQAVHRVFDVGGRFLDHVELQPWRKLAVDVGDLGHHAVHHLHGVGSGLPLDIQQDRRLALVVGEGAALGHAVLGVADVADADGHAVDVLDDDVVELLDLLDPAHRAHAQLLGPANDAAPGGLDVFGADGPLHVLGGEVVAVQLVQVEHYVDLALAPAADVDRGDAVHGFQPAAHDLVGHLGQLAHAGIAAEGHRYHRVRVGVGLAHHRGKHVRRHLPHRAGGLFAHLFDRLGDVLVQHEGDDDVARAFGHHRAQLVNAADRRNRFFQRHDDLRDHLLGAGARQPRIDVDGGRVCPGEQIHAQVEKAEQPHHGEEQDQHEGENRTLDADLGEAHG
jgi:hypothetical protein